MQSVPQGWTAEEADKFRSVAHNLQVSWKKEATIGNRTFTIGASAIGGNDAIGINPGAIGGPGLYKYFDESDYVISLGYERGLHLPTGGLNMALAEAVLDNNSRRFTPQYLGGSGELFTSIVSRRPLTISTGFHFGNINQIISQFAGLLNYAPEIDISRQTIKLKAADYVSYFNNKSVDETSMYTSVTTDQIIQTLFRQSGMSTAQYELDAGLNTIPFALIPRGAKFSDIINDLAQAENAQVYQDEEGIFRFENRQHWNVAPFNQVQAVIHTAQVINAQSTSYDNIVNVVEITGEKRKKHATAEIYNSTSPTEILAGQSIEYFANYEDPLLQVTSVTITANTASDGSGSNISSSIQTLLRSDFSMSSKFILRNNSSNNGYITSVVINGRYASIDREISIREKRGLSVTAFEERVLSVNNIYIQDEVWANSYANLILNLFAFPANLQKLTIRAMPRLQLGDLVSWQGRLWRIFNKATTLDRNLGFISELLLLKYDSVTYFTIGISSIGGTDAIAS